MKQALRITIVGVAWTLASSIAIASTPEAPAPSYSGTITGFFDSPVLSGDFLQPRTRLPVSSDNTSTAVVSGIDTSSVTWGDNKGGTPPSALTFPGRSLTGVVSGQVFPLGTLPFFNGTGLPASLIFGVTMHLSAGGDITPFTGPVAMVPTQNANIDRVSDADSLFFSNFEIPSALGAFEGAAVTAIVYGKINADAQLEITSIGLAQGEADHGCVDEGPRVDSRGPCTSTCGEVCAAIALASAGPLCGSEPLPAVLNRRIGQGLRPLRQAESPDSGGKAKRGGTLERRQPRGVATV